MTTQPTPAAAPTSAAGAGGLVIESLSKSYGSVTVLRDISMTVAPGEVHALLGANGAGKSTLIKCIAGMTAPDAGTIRIGAQSFGSLTPGDAWDAGVGVVYQELSVMPELSVVDNIFLGAELRAGPFVRRGAQRAEARRLLESFSMDVRLESPLADLSVAEAQAVEIVKVLRRSPNVLVLDEPTAALTQAESAVLQARVLQMKANGIPVLYVTHRLDEVFEIADRVTVVRGGRVALSAAVADTTPGQLVEAIIGREGHRHVRRDAQMGDTPLLQVEDLVGPGIGPIDVSVRPGEILGVYGLVGSGRTELVESIFASRDRHSGTIDVDGQQHPMRRCTDAVSAGIALVPSDRKTKGLFLDQAAIDNVVSPYLRRRFGLRSRSGEKKAFTDIGQTLDLQPPRPDLAARRFSGGNQQKLVLGRWLRAGTGCRVLLLDEPTQGVDVGARDDLYTALRSFADKERAVIVTSSEPDELVQIADRIIVLSRGRISGELEGDSITEPALVALAHTTSAHPPTENDGTNA